MTITILCTTAVTLCILTALRVAMQADAWSTARKEKDLEKKDREELRSLLSAWTTDDNLSGPHSLESATMKLFAEPMLRYTEIKGCAYAGDKLILSLKDRTDRILIEPVISVTSHLEGYRISLQGNHETITPLIFSNIFRISSDRPSEPDCLVRTEDTKGLPVSKARFSWNRPLSFYGKRLFTINAANAIGSLIHIAN